jgi:hypothetical protein
MAGGARRAAPGERLNLEPAGRRQRRRRRAGPARECPSAPRVARRGPVLPAGARTFVGSAPPSPRARPPRAPPPHPTGRVLTSTPSGMPHRGRARGGAAARARAERRPALLARAAAGRRGGATVPAGPGGPRGCGRSWTRGGPGAACGRRSTASARRGCRSTPARTTCASRPGRGRPTFAAAPSEARLAPSGGRTLRLGRACRGGPRADTFAGGWRRTAAAGRGARVRSPPHWRGALAGAPAGRQGAGRGRGESARVRPWRWPGAALELDSANSRPPRASWRRRMEGCRRAGGPPPPHPRDTTRAHDPVIARSVTGARTRPARAQPRSRKAPLGCPGALRWRSRAPSAAAAGPHTHSSQAGHDRTAPRPPPTPPSSPHTPTQPSA